jgi:anti-anti-sigma regulatory factor
LPFSIDSSGDGQIVTLKGAVTIRHAHELAAMLREAMEAGSVVGVDTGGLEDIDTCILQLLCSLRKTVPALSFDNPSEAFSRAVDRCGLRRELLGAQEAV